MTTRIIHRVWDNAAIELGIPDYSAKLWKHCNPGWEIRDWGEEVVCLFNDLSDVINDIYEHSAEPYVEASPIIGYALVRDFGGVFVPASVGAFQLTDLPDTAWATHSKRMFGSPNPNDPFWIGLLAELPSHYFRRDSDPGPAFISDYASRMPGFLESAKLPILAA